MAWLKLAEELLGCDGRELFGADEWMVAATPHMPDEGICGPPMWLVEVD